MTKGGSITRALFVLASLAIATTAAGQSSNRVLVVDDDLRCANAAHSTIQSALDAAQSGDTVRVCAGTYTEELFIRTPLTLKAKAGQVVIVRGFILVLADDVEINGLVIDAQGNRPAGITVDVTQRAVIRNCTVRNGANAGIEVFESDDALVTNNILHDNAREGVRLIEAFDSEVIDNVSRDNGGNGIAVFEGANNLVRLNTLRRNKLNGIDVCFDTRLNRVDRNDVTGSGMAGILICDGATDSAVTKNRTLSNKIDVLDQSVGTGIGGTDTMWRNNTCALTTPTGLCRFVRRVRSSSTSSQ